MFSRSVARALTHDGRADGDLSRISGNDEAPGPFLPRASGGNTSDKWHRRRLAPDRGHVYRRWRLGSCCRAYLRYVSLFFRIGGGARHPGALWRRYEVPGRGRAARPSRLAAKYPARAVYREPEQSDWYSGSA